MPKGDNELKNLASWLPSQFAFPNGATLLKTSSNSSEECSRTCSSSLLLQTQGGQLICEPGQALAPLQASVSPYVK